MAVWLWTVLPLIVLHLWMWRRCKDLLRFQLLIDVGLVVVAGPAVLIGLDLSPVGILGQTPPYVEWTFSEDTELQPTHSDLVFQLHPWWDAAREQMLQGRFPSIAPEIGGGLPLLANGQVGVFAPVMVPVWCLGPEAGSTVMAVWKIEAAAVGAFLFLGSWGLGWRAAAVGGLSWGLGCFQIAWLLSGVGWSTAFLPWAWWMMSVALRRRSGPGTWIAVGTACGWAMGCGVNPETAAIAVGSALLAGVICHPRRFLRVLLISTTAAIVTVALAWPTLQAIGESAKVEHYLEAPPNLEAPPLELRLDALAQTLLPMVHGHPGEGGFRAAYPHAAAAAGIGGFAFALVFAGAIRRRRRHLAAAAFAVIAVAAVLAFRVPPIDSILVGIPPLDRMTLPRFLMLLPWGLALLAAIGVEGLERGQARRAWIRLLPVAAALTLAAWAWQPHLTIDGLLTVSSVVAMAIVALAAPRFVGFLPMLVCLELVALAWGINPVASTSDRLPQPSIIVELQRLVAEDPGRVIGLGSMLPANLASRYDLVDIRAFDPVRPASFWHLMSAFGQEDPVLGNRVTRAPAGLAGAWGVRWAVALKNARLPGWQLAWNGDGGSIWRNPTVLSEVRVVGRTRVLNDDFLGLAEVDFATTAIVDSMMPTVRAQRMSITSTTIDSNAVRVELQCDASCLVVVAKPWAVGWQAKVDGIPAEIVRTNVAGLGLVVPAGRRVVELEYRPWSLASAARVGDQ